MTKAIRAPSTSALRMGGFFVAALLAGCIPGASTEQAKAEAAEKQEDCQTIYGKRYCFPRHLVYLPGDGGFLLKVPLGVLDAPCNRSRKLYPFVIVLFGEDRIPDPEVLKKNNADFGTGAAVEVFRKQDFIFKKSRSEFEECQASKGGPPRMICGRYVNWNGALVKFSYDKQCQAEMREFAADLENLLERGRK